MYTIWRSIILPNICFQSIKALLGRVVKVSLTFDYKCDTFDVHNRDHIPTLSVKVSLHTPSYVQNIHMSLRYKCLCYSFPRNMAVYHDIAGKLLIVPINANNSNPELLYIPTRSLPLMISSFVKPQHSHMTLETSLLSIQWDFHEGTWHDIIKNVSPNAIETTLRSHHNIIFYL